MRTASPLVAALFLLCSLARAQTAGVISGTVYGPSGAVVVGATVTLESSDGDWEQNRVTGNDGHYSFSVPAPGNYRMEIQAPGFKPCARPGLVVAGTAHKRSDLASRPLRFQTIRDHLIAYAPDEKPLIVIAVIHGRRNPRIMVAMLRGRE